MSGSLRVLFKLSTICLVINYHFHMLPNMKVAADLNVESLWNTFGNNTVPCLLDRRYANDSIFRLRGSSTHTCNVQITTSEDLHTGLELPDSPRHTSFVYIEREGDHQEMDCNNKFVVIKENVRDCGVLFSHSDLKVHVEGNVSIVIKDVPKLEGNFVCPETKTNDRHYANVSDVFECSPSHILGYNYQLSCIPKVDKYGPLCWLDFDSNCSAMLGNREVKLQCSDDAVKNHKLIMLVYPSDLLSLNIGFNNIIHIHQDSFHGLHNLRILNLEENKITYVPEKLFQGLNLQVLILRHNFVHKLDPLVFQGLANLSELDLSDMYLRLLPFGLFSGLHNLHVLNINDNTLHELPNGIFSDLQNLTQLRIQNNQLQKLPSGLFSGLYNLNLLFLHQNNLKSLQQNIFNNLRNLESLYLQNNQLRELSSGLFSDLYKLSGLLLDDNHITSLHQSTFNNLTNLMYLYFSNNTLHELPKGIFSRQYNLELLFLKYNNLLLHPNLFDGLYNLKFLNLGANELQVLPSGIFSDLHDLLFLQIESNNLVALPLGIIEGLKNLNLLQLDNNKLTFLHPRLFERRYASTMLSVDIQKNELTHLDKAIFKGMINLLFLHLAHNKLTTIHPNIFHDCLNLTVLDMSFNQLKDFPEIYNLFHLEYLNLRHNSLIEITRSTFLRLPKNINFLVGQHEICMCYTRPDVNCSASFGRSPYLTCETLLSDRVLVVMMWLIGLNAMLGNLFVLVLRKKNIENVTFQNLLLSNLALSDFLMGVYMTIVASANSYFGENFPIHAESWRSGIICRIAGAMAIISSEGSVFFVTLISIDRFIGIKYPMSTRKVGKKIVVTVVSSTWLISMALGIVPSVLASGEKGFKFYDIPNVCIGLPLALTESYTTTETLEYIFYSRELFLIYPKPGFSTKYEGLITGMYFSTALFLGLNGICYIFILLCYISIVINVRKSSTKSGRRVEMSQQIKLTTKVTVIVATDFLCWFPIIVLGILVQTRLVTLPTVVYEWAVTVIIPINSAINPYLYTVADAVSKYLDKETRKMKSLLNCEVFIFEIYQHHR